MDYELHLIVLPFLRQDEHKKNYEADEDKERFEIFKVNVKRIIEHNDKFSKGEVGYSMGINQFADKKPEEYRPGVIRP